MYHPMCYIWCVWYHFIIYYNLLLYSISVIVSLCIIPCVIYGVCDIISLCYSSYGLSHSICYCTHCISSHILYLTYCILSYMSRININTCHRFIMALYIFSSWESLLLLLQGHGCLGKQWRRPGLLGREI